MKLRYLVEIQNPETHIVKVKIDSEKPSDMDKVQFYIPSWSPGSYLMREYTKNIRSFRVLNKTGEFLFFDQIEKGIWGE